MKNIKYQIYIFMDTVNDLSRQVDSFLKSVYSNKTANAVIGLFLVLYASLAAPKLPKSVAKIFGNKIFKMVFLFLIAYMASRNVSVAIISAVALVVSMQTFSFHQANEKVQQIVEEEATRYEEATEATEDIVVTSESENNEEVENVEYSSVEEEEKTTLLTQGENEVTLGESGEDYAKYQSMEENNVSEEGELGEYGPEGEYRPRARQEEETYTGPENDESLFGEVIEEPEGIESNFGQELVESRNDKREQRIKKIHTNSRRRSNMLMEEEAVLKPEEQVMFQDIEEEGVPRPVGELGPEEELFRPEEETMFRPEEQAMFRPEEETMFRPEEQAMFRPEEESTFRPEEQAMFRPEEEKVVRKRRTKSALKQQEESTFRPEEQAMFRPEEESTFRPEEQAMFRPEQEKVVRKRRTKSALKQQEESTFRPEEQAMFRPEEEAMFKPEEEDMFRPEEEKVARKRRTASVPKQPEETSYGVGGYSGNEYATCS